MMQLLQTIISMALLYLLVDLIAGFFHWAEDTLGTPDSPIWGPAFVAPNVIHHDKPNEMNKIHWFRNSLPIYGICVAVLGVSWATGHLGWQAWFISFIGLFAQQSHRWSHAPRKSLPRGVVFLQRMGVLQGARHHWKHHSPPHNTHFCVMTPWLNPLFDRLGFWRFLERLLVPIFGAPRRPDLKEKHWYRGKAIWA